MPKEDMQKNVLVDPKQFSEVTICTISHQGGALDYLETVASLKLTLEPIVFDIREQPEFHFSRKLLASQRRATFRRSAYGVRLASKSGVVRKLITWLVVYPLRQTLASYLKPRKFSRTRYVEEILTQKHLAAWGRIASSNSPVGLILESDAGLADRGPELLAWLAKLLNSGVDSLTSIFVAEGMSFADLQVFTSKSSLSSDGVEILVSNPATSNTNCGYFVTKSLAIALADLGRDVKHIPADWLLAGLLQRLNAVSMHVVPAPIIHGSRRRAQSTVRET